MRAARIALAALALSLWASPGLADDQITTSFGGQFRVRGFHLRNGSLARQLDPGTRIALNMRGTDSIDERQTYFDTRFRFRFTIARGQELTLNTQFEIGDLTFGGAGAGLGTDGVNIETRWLHLDYTPAELPLTFRAGLYSVVTPHSLVLSTDAAGLQVRYDVNDGDLALSLDFLKAIDNSRVDLDGDGLLDNDFNDRDIWVLRADVTRFQPFTFGLYGVADVDNSQDSPQPSNFERDIYWAGAYLEGKVSIVSLTLDAVYATGDIRNGANPGSVQVEGYAADARLAFDIPYVGLELIAGYGSGDDPSTTRNEAFPVISTFYAHSNIIFDDFGGFNVTGSSISGVAHLSGILRSSVTDQLQLTALAVYALYTADPRRPTNVRRNLSGRELGLELGLNADYTVNEAFTLRARTGIFFPGSGYLTTFDSPDDDPLIEIVLGAEFRF